MIDLTNYAPISQEFVPGRPFWLLIGLICGAIILGLIAVHFLDSDHGAAVAVSWTTIVLCAIVVGMSLMAMPEVIRTSQQYRSQSLTKTIEQQARVSDLRCNGLTAEPTQQQVKAYADPLINAAMPWQTKTDVTYACTWKYDQKTYNGRLKINVRYSSTSSTLILGVPPAVLPYSASGPAYFNGYSQAQLLSKQGDIWTPDANS